MESKVFTKTAHSFIDGVQLSYGKTEFKVISKRLYFKDKLLKTIPSVAFAIFNDFIAVLDGRFIIVYKIIQVDESLLVKKIFTSLSHNNESEYVPKIFRFINGKDIVINNCEPTERISVIMHLHDYTNTSHIFINSYYPLFTHFGYVKPFHYYNQLGVDKNGFICSNHRHFKNIKLGKTKNLQIQNVLSLNNNSKYVCCIFVDDTSKTHLEIFKLDYKYCEINTIIHKFGIIKNEKPYSSEEIDPSYTESYLNKNDYIYIGKIKTNKVRWKFKKIIPDECKELLRIFNPKYSDYFLPFDLILQISKYF